LDLNTPKEIYMRRKFPLHRSFIPIKPNNAVRHVCGETITKAIEGTGLRISMTSITDKGFHHERMGDSYTSETKDIHLDPADEFTIRIEPDDSSQSNAVSNTDKHGWKTRVLVSKYSDGYKDKASLFMANFLDKLTANLSKKYPRSVGGWGSDYYFTCRFLISDGGVPESFRSDLNEAIDTSLKDMDKTLTELKKLYAKEVNKKHIS
jgi:hypothetical protein